MGVVSPFDCLQAAKQIQCSLEYTTLKRITQTTEIYYDPDPMVSPDL